MLEEDLTDTADSGCCLSDECCTTKLANCVRENPVATFLGAFTFGLALGIYLGTARRDDFERLGGHLHSGYDFVTDSAGKVYRKIRQK